MRRASLLLVAAALAALLAGTVRGEKIVHEERSLYRHIIVYEEEDLRCMRFTRVSYGRQSCFVPAEPRRIVFDYVKMMLGALYLAPEPRAVLVVGLGGGTLVDALRSLYPVARIDAVEIDAAVIRVAEKYFDFVPGPRVNVHEEDGRVFVKRALRDGRKYDFVMLDAFDHEYIPEHLLTQEFLQEVKRLLTPAGVLAANTFSSSRLYDHESVTYASVYGRFYNLKGRNRVILARADGLPPLDDVRRNAQRLQPQLAPLGVDTAWLLGLFSDAADWRGDARVLTDRYSPSNLLNSAPR